MPCPLHQNSPPAAPSEKGEKLVRSAKFAKDVCKRVGKGATPHVAAFAKGLSLKDFWLIWGMGLEALDKEESGKDTDEREKAFAKFVHEIQLALAEARMEAEEKVFNKSPHVYLECSPASTGGNHWGRRRSEPPTDEERFARSGFEYLCYAESCRMGPYSLDPAPKKRRELETECVHCRADFFDKLADEVKEVLGEDAIEIEVDERGRRIERKVSSEPHPQPPRRKQGGGFSSHSPFTERGEGGEVSPHGSDP